jgi:hypothetical protein
MRNKRSRQDEKYLDYIRNKPCCITGKETNVVAHHVRLGQNGGIGLKPSDYRTIPLDAFEHRRLHDIGEKTYYGDSVNPNALIACYLFTYLIHEQIENDIIDVLEDLIIKKYSD